MQPGPVVREPRRTCPFLRVERACSPKRACWELGFMQQWEHTDTAPEREEAQLQSASGAWIQSPRQVRQLRSSSLQPYGICSAKLACVC